MTPTAPGEQHAGAPTHLIVGRVLAPWGHRGQVRVEILTDFPERFAALEEILVGEDLVPYRLEAARLHKGSVVLKLEGVDDPEQASALRGALLYIPVSQAMPLEQDQYFHYQILGLEVWTVDGRYLGRISEILETGANDVYVVQSDGREVLIPAVADVVQEVDLERHRLIVAPPPGLLEEA
ncbi:MAG TPA: ribosome maturation factor RimM [Anaerolineae bacterium]|nr:ribosome maturation factor RimM [Anaerolineae bacterium]HPL29048.1 ribosome maturation factor RimM [Anaerolineae bacterium]